MPHTPLRLAFHRPWPGTRRGLCLWLFALAFILVGLTAYIPDDLSPQARANLIFALSLAPAPFWGWVFIGAGFLSAWASYCHFSRDRYGFILLSTFSGAWALVYMCGFLFYGAGLRALGGAIIWLLYSAILTLIAGFPNVALRQPPVRVVDEEA